MDHFHVETAISEKAHLLLPAGQIGGRLFEFFAQQRNSRVQRRVALWQQRLDKLVGHAFG